MIEIHNMFNVWDQVFWIVNWEVLKWEIIEVDCNYNYSKEDKEDISIQYDFEYKIVTGFLKTERKVKVLPKDLIFFTLEEAESKLKEINKINLYNNNMNKWYGSTLSSSTITWAINSLAGYNLTWK